MTRLYLMGVIQAYEKEIAAHPEEANRLEPELARCRHALQLMERRRPAAEVNAALWSNRAA